MLTTGTVVLLVLALVVAVLLLLALQVLRRLQQLRRGGVDVALRPAAAAAAPDAARPVDAVWHSGIARYRGDQFRWFRVTGLSTAPNVVLDRTDVQIVDRRPALDGELHLPSSTVLRCRTPVGTWDVAMTPDVLTGFSSWLESTPPGRSTGYRQAS